MQQKQSSVALLVEPQSYGLGPQEGSTIMIYHCLVAIALSSVSEIKQLVHARAV